MCELFHLRSGSVRRLPVVPKNRQRRAPPKLDSRPFKPSAHADGVVSAAEVRCEPQHPLNPSSNQLCDRSPPAGVQAYRSCGPPQQLREKRVSQLASKCLDCVLLHAIMLRRTWRTGRITKRRSTQQLAACLVGQDAKLAAASRATRAVGERGRNERGRRRSRQVFTRSSPGLPASAV